MSATLCNAETFSSLFVFQFSGIRHGGTLLTSALGLAIPVALSPSSAISAEYSESKLPCLF
jgi:hypothetical protein